MRRYPTRRRRLAIVAVGLATAGCFGPSAAHLEDRLSDISFPASWQLIHSEFIAAGGDGCHRLLDRDCPRVERVYLAPAPRSQAVEDARVAFQAAGYTTSREPGPGCDDVEGRICSVTASNDETRLQFDLGQPGEVLGDATPAGASDGLPPPADDELIVEFRFAAD